MFNQDIMKNCIVYLSKNLQKNGHSMSETKLYKLLWFANLNYADNHGDLLFSDLFLKKDYWPVPELIYDYIDNVKSKWSDDFIEISTSFWESFSRAGKQNTIKALTDANDDFLTPSMKDSLDFAIKNYGNKSAWELSNLTHKRWGAWDVASYGSVVDLTIDMQNHDMKELVEERIDEIKVLLKTLKYA